MKQIQLLLMGSLLALGLVACSTSTPPAPVLKAGEKVVINQELTINVVFVGFQEGSGATQVSLDKFKAGLSSRYRTKNRNASFYPGSNAFAGFTGNDFSFKYNLVFANQGFQDSFFGFLNSNATAAPAPTLYQTAYNCQYVPSTTRPACTTPSTRINLAQPISQNFNINAVRVEKWLADNAGGIGVNTKNYTVFLINWFGRPDFKHHVYIKNDEPDPDTNINFSDQRSSRRMVAWGGTTAQDADNAGGLGSLNRIWFMDLSAGPESSAGSWDISNIDFDGNGSNDYRIPPIWEYGSTKNTYRRFNTLSEDLAKIVRYVGINLLFTPSPIYASDITPLTQPTKINVNTVIYQGTVTPPNKTGRDLYKLDYVLGKLRQLQPTNTFTGNLAETPYTPNAQAFNECFLLNSGGSPCTAATPNNLPSGLGLFAYNFSRLTTLPPQNGAEYEVPVFAYATPDIPNAGLLGLADDDYTTGVQSLVYGWIQPQFAAVGFGLSQTIAHEVGHHLALSHPHDGYDFEADVDYGGTGKYYFAWLGDYSNTVMHYLSLTGDFGQFNQDSMNRYLTTGYLNQATAIMAEIDKSSRKAETDSAIIQANSKAREAVDQYQKMEYAAGLLAARDAYVQVVNAAKAIGVNPVGFKWQSLWTGQLPAIPQSVANILTPEQIAARIQVQLQNNPTYRERREAYEAFEKASQAKRFDP